MDTYVIVITLIGLAVLGMAWMPVISQKTRISYSIIYVLLGIAAYHFIPNLPDPLPRNQIKYALHLAELLVLISLMSTGLRIDQPFNLRSWNIPFRLVFITMVLTIGLVAVVGVTVLSFSLPAAMLLGAVLAPTDPVLASDVQVGPPLEPTKDNPRFSLTAEAGMNDGMAFPFVYLAVSLVAVPTADHSFGWHWFLYDFLYRIIAGVGVGFLIGRILGWAVFKLPNHGGFLKTRDGFVALATTLLVYGITELIHGYGFIAVFTAAITIRNFEIHNKYHRKLHSFTDEIERILLAIVLILFGGALVRGILDHLSWPLALFGLAFVFIIRPVCAYVALIKTPLHPIEKLVVSFFGIRGVGSIFYLSFAFNSFSFKHQDVLWSVVAFIILASIVLHGSTAIFMMRKVQEKFSEEVEIEEKE